jgi:RNA polymerase sigma factor (sigma-70 family)
MADRPLNRLLHRLRRTVRSGSAGVPTDGELLGRFVERADAAAFEELVRRHGAMVFAVCRRVLRHEADAEDAFQATFLLLARKAAAVAPRARVGCWLYGVARTTAVRARTLARRRRAKEREAAAIRPERSDSPNHAELAELLDREIGRLPARYRAVILLCDLEGVPVREAARRLGCPQGTAASRLARGRALLAKRLLRAGLTAPAAAAAVAAGAASAAVPVRLSQQTVTVALTMFGSRAAEAVSAPVAALVAGGLRAMFVTRLVTAGALVVALGAAGAGTGVMARQVATAGGAGQAPAPGPADGPEVDKRLRSLEQKMDRVTQLLEARERESPRPKVPADADLRELREARDKLVAELETRQKEYLQFRQKLPHLLLRTNSGNSNIYVDRLLKIDQRRTDYRIKLEETKKRLEQIKKVYKDDGRTAATFLIAATGLKIPLDNTTDLDKVLLDYKVKREIAISQYGEQHPSVQQFDKAIAIIKDIYRGKASDKNKDADVKDKGVDVIELYVKAMEAEVKDLNTLLQTLDEQFDREQKQARDLNNYEIEDDMYRDAIKRRRDMLDDLEKRIREATNRPSAK